MFPSTYYYLSSSGAEAVDPEKKKKYLASQAKNTTYYQACSEKSSRMMKTNPWVKTRRRIAAVLLLIGWVLLISVIYQVSQFDYEMANFDPYEILGVSTSSSAKEIKKKYREMSLKYHPDKPTGNEKLFMKLTKAYDALTDETAKYNWEHYGNPDGPQAMQVFLKEKKSEIILTNYLCFKLIAVWHWSTSLDCGGKKFHLGFRSVHFDIHDWTTDCCLLLVV